MKTNAALVYLVGAVNVCNANSSNIVLPRILRCRYYVYGCILHTCCATSHWSKRTRTLDASANRLDVSHSIGTQGNKPTANMTCDFVYSETWVNDVTEFHYRSRHYDAR